MNNEVAVSKRQAISKANRVMFGSIAAASAIASIAGVTVYYFSQTILFQGKIIGAQRESLIQVESSIENIKEVEKELKKIDSNTGLTDLMREKGNTNRLQVIADALPVRPDSLQVGAILGNNILNIPGIKITSIIPPSYIEESVAPVEEEDSKSQNPQPEGVSPISNRVKPLEFSFTVSARDGEKKNEAGETVIVKAIDQIIEILHNMEKSIRAFNIKSFRVEQTNLDNPDGGKTGGMNFSVTGEVYYIPQVEVTPRAKTIYLNDSDAKKSSLSKGGK